MSSCTNLGRGVVSEATEYVQSSGGRLVAERST